MLNTIKDHRRGQGRQYDLAHMLLFSIMALLSNADSYRKIHLFIDTHRERLNKKWKYQEWLRSICLVRINRKGIHILDRPPQGETKGRHICADAIRNVCVGKASPDRSFSSVVVETDAGSHAIGEGLGMDALEWLKNCILSKIAIGQEFT